MTDKSHDDPLLFGDINAPGGALFKISNIADCTRVKVEHTRAAMRRDGFAITAEVEAELERLRVEDEKRMTAEWRAMGVSESIKQLFAATKKKDAERIAKSLTLTWRDLATLAFNADQIGFKYELKRREFLHESRQVTDEDVLAIVTNGKGPLKPAGAKAFKKVQAAFEEKRGVTVHMFVGDNDQWHCFNFTDKEALVKPGHWKEGTHVHYVSHAWSSLKPHEVLSAFENKDPGIHGNHIRLVKTPA